ncbi:MAG: TIGR01777 family oxidoreductase [Planctomycetota bacterium]
MASFTYASNLPFPSEEVFKWHAAPGVLERLLPPWEKVTIDSKQGGIAEGGRVVFRIRKGPLLLRWVAVHKEYEEGRLFTDVQEEGPFASWKHFHRFLPEGEDGCRLEDHVDYELPFGELGNTFMGDRVLKQLKAMFQFRHLQTRIDLSRHRRYNDAGPLRVAVTGATGLVGSAIASFLASGGHHVHPMVRRSPEPGREEIEWNPQAGRIDSAALEGLDGIIHLAGENIAAGRWNPVRKEAIFKSRVEGTRLLSKTLAKLEKRPRFLICASAIGYYGPQQDEMITEEHDPGEGFLAEVSRAWEEAAAPARDAGIRVVNLRIGVVLSPQGGALAKMLTPFRFGLGGRMGTGRQYVSWIALDDLTGAIHHLMFQEDMEGPVNATAPEPLRQADMARTLGKILGRPTLSPLPEGVVRMALGEMGQALLLEGARVMPSRLIENGFEFLYPTMEEALRAMLGKWEEK